MLGDVVAWMLVDCNHADDSCVAEGEIVHQESSLYVCLTTWTFVAKMKT